MGILPIRFTWDALKNTRNIQERGLDFANAAPIWDAPMLVWIDKRRDYGEIREMGLGILEGRVMAVGWVRRGEHHIHIFSFRKANARETKRYKTSAPAKDDSPSEGGQDPAYPPD